MTSNIMLPPDQTPAAKPQPSRVVRVTRPAPTVTVRSDCCAWRGDRVGWIDCSCAGKPSLYACRCPDSEKPYCLLHASGKRVKALHFDDGSVTEFAPETRINRAVPICATCPHRAPNAATVIPAGPLRFFRTVDLYEQTQALLRILPEFASVVAIPRSGMIPASLIATARHVPLFTLQSSQLVNVGAGYRAHSFRPPSQAAPLLLVDDTTWSGAQMRRAVAALQGKHVIRAAVYTHAAAHVDYCGTLCEADFLVEWNVFNNAGLMRGHSGIAACRGGIALDFDGILSEEPRISDHQDLTGFMHWLTTARPWHLPVAATIKLICSGRLERWREQTMNWLARHGVRVDRLLLDPARDVHARGDYAAVAARKGREFGASECTLFVESDRRQAPIIRDVSGKPVICLPTGEVFS